MIAMVPVKYLSFVVCCSQK